MELPRMAVLATCGCALALVAWTVPASAATFTVDLPTDAGGSCPADPDPTPTNCTLRQAVTAANLNGNPLGTDTIVFNLGAGTQTITVGAGFPTVIQRVTIDGSTVGGQRIEVTGAGGLAAGTDGLVFASGSTGSTLRGLVVNGFPDAGVEVQSDFVTLAGNWIGTDDTGTAAQANGTGVRLTSTTDFVDVGTSAAADRNVISGNTGRGVDIVAGASDNDVENNYVGPGSNGSTDLGNGEEGILVAGTDTEILAGNVISGNTGDGVELSAGATGQIIGSVIGLAADGTTALPNLDPSPTVTSAGVRFASNAFSSVIALSVISANEQGIAVTSTGGNVTVQGNLIGLNSAGTADRGNVQAGIDIRGSNVDVGTGTVVGRNIISGSSSAGVFIAGSGGTDNEVRGNYIGTNAAGTAAVPNDQYGVYVGTAGNTIGGAVATAGTCDGSCNVISGNGGSNTAMPFGGILLQAPATVTSNYIGVNPAGSSALANNHGVIVQFAGPVTVGSGNVISGNLGHGVWLNTGSGQSVTGNIIGLDDAGAGDLGNALAGVLVETPGAQIGGTDAAARNVVSANLGAGIELQVAGTVQGNYVGLGTDGTGAHGNGDSGILAYAGASTIGGSAPGARNVVADNTFGVTVPGGAGGTVVQGNWIGTQANGTTAQGNTYGVVLDGPSDVVVGGTGAGEGNRIAHNTNFGVSVEGANAVRNRIRGNEIFSNGGLGIDLAADGATNNDVFERDADSGPNGLQNFPTAQAVYAGGQTRFTGDLASKANETFSLDLFVSSSGCDPSGLGEGQTYAGTIMVTTDGSGQGHYNAQLPITPGLFDGVTGTATDAQGNTSEFGSCGGATSGTTLAAGDAGAPEGATATVTIARAGSTVGAATVRYATADGSARAGEDYTAVSGTLTFGPLDKSMAVSIPLASDSASEGTESFELILSDADGDGVVTDARATVAIADVASAGGGGGGGGGGGLAPSNREPDSDINRVVARLRAARLTGFSGRASDPDGNLARVEVAVVGFSGGARAAVKRCRHLQGTGRLSLARPGRTGRCRPTRLLRATLRRGRWTFRLKRRLPRGSYVVYSRAVDSAGRRETRFSARDRNRRAFRLT